MILRTRKDDVIIIRLVCLHPDYEFDGYLEEGGPGNVYKEIGPSKDERSVIEWTLKARSASYNLVATTTRNESTSSARTQVVFEVSAWQDTGLVPHATKSANPEAKLAENRQGGYKDATFPIDINKL